MKKRVFRCAFSVFLSICLVLGISGCSGNVEMTRENVTATVETVETALKEFDKKTLEKYVQSETLGYILKLSNGKDQYAELGRSIFGNLTMEIEQIDLENNTVTVSVLNKDMYLVASSFTQNLLSSHSKVQLLNMLNNEEFLNSSLSILVDGIEKSQMNTEPTTVTLTITQGKKNLVLGFDDTAENAVSGSALGAIKSIIG